MKKVNDNPPPEGDISGKNHPHREPKRKNRLSIEVFCPHFEAIIDENRIETALRNALAVPDLEVRSVLWIPSN